HVDAHTVPTRRSSDLTSSFSESTPVQVTGGHQFVDVQASVSNSAGLKADGSVWCWGDNTYGQIGEGLPSPNHRSTPTEVIGGHRDRKRTRLNSSHVKI